MSDATTALAAAQAAAASAQTASEGADFVATKAAEVNADKVDAQAAKTDAQAAAAAAGAQMWVASEAVTTATVRQAPDGSRIRSTAARTTGTSFDATEQTFWEPVLSTAGTMEQVALTATIAAGKPIHAWAYGVRTGTGTAQNTPLAAAFAAAHAAGGAAHVVLPPGVITIDGTFPLDGYSAGMRGAGGGNQSGVGRTGTVLKCINQTGAVLDFDGFLWPADMVGRILFEGFTVQGDNTADPTGAKRGIYSPDGNYPIGYAFKDITVVKCGGAPIEVWNSYFATWENLTACDPVSVVANDVPYIKTPRCNGTVFINVGLRSQVYETGGFGTHPGDVGASGAWVMHDGGDLSHVYTAGAMIGCWAENLHIPSGGCVVAARTMSVAYRDWSFFDCFKVNGATNTAYIHLQAVTPHGSGLGRQGGNSVTGKIEGQTAYHDSSPDVWIDHGVRDSQGGNLIQGTKGWGGKNVLLDSGIEYTTVMLMGGERIDTSKPGWIDNSGKNTNTLIDMSRGIWTFGVTSAGAYPISIPGTPRWSSYISGRYYGPHPGGHSTSATGTGILTLVPFWVSASFTAVKIAVEVITAAASSTVRLGIYGSSATDQPAALLLDAGTVDSTTTGVKEITIDHDFTPGVYWLAAVNQGGNPTLRTVGTGTMAPVAASDFTSGAVNCYYKTGVTGTLPNPWTGFTAGMQGYRVMVKAE